MRLAKQSNVYCKIEERPSHLMQQSTTNEPTLQVPHTTEEATPKGRARLDTRAYLAAGVTVILWASAFPGIRAALPHYSPVHIALLRYLVASLALAIYAVCTRMRLPRWRDLPRFALLGLVGIAYYNIALNSGEVHVPSAEASFLVASSPIFMTIEAMLFLKERVRIWGWLGIALSCLGIAVVTLSQAASLQLDFWALLVLTVALAQSLFSIGQKSLLTRYSAFETTAYSMWMGAIFLLIFTPGLFSEIGAAPLAATGAVVYLGIFPGVLGYLCWAYALSRMPGSRAASFLYLVPLLAAGIAWLWLGEVPAPLAFGGGVLVLAGVILVNTRGHRRAS
jgi:drug/metabolite transporter (DMT)-like permease